VGIISTEFTISLDGFVAGPTDDITNIFGWYTSGDTEFSIEGEQKKVGGIRPRT
jgi:hypothetical protein